MSGRLSLVLVVVVVICSTRSHASPEPKAGEHAIRFNRDIRPILSDNCFACHGADPGHRKAGLRLDREEGLFGKREKGAAVVRGKPQSSQLFLHVISTDDDELMPPAKSHKVMTAAQKETMRLWIEQGAPWEPHWSLVQPVRPALPVVKDASWVRNPIDAFVLARLESAALSPAPPVDRAALIRRVSLDIIGLPPTPQEVEAFLNDRSTDAYEKVVDRLLASPHYGEHRARYWLDAARYGDTHGIHNDNYVELWPYRDWVIGAFNRNLPFDRFTVEQIAGDLLPGRTLEQQIATGFHRCNATTSEGGSIDAEVEAIYAKDRVETTCTVWLGMTGQCAVCHDHKFDPLTMRDFYSMSAFFRNTPQRAMDGNISDTPPNIPVPQPQDRSKWERFQKQQADLRARQDLLKKEVATLFDAWAKSDAPRKLTEPLDPAAQTVALGTVAGKDEEIIASIDGQGKLLPLPKGINWGDGPVKGDKAIDFAPRACITLDDSGDFEADQPFSLGGWVFIPTQEGQYAIASKLDSKAKVPAGWVLEVNNRIVSFRLLGDKTGRDALQVRANNSLRLEGGKWAHLFVTYDGSRHPDGLTLYVNGKPQYTEQSDDVTLAGSIRNRGPMRLGSDGKRDFRGGALRDFRVYRRELRAEEITVVSKWSELHKALQKSDAKLTAGQRQDLLLLYVTRFDPPYKQTMDSLDKVDDGVRHIRRHSPVALVMAEKPTSRPSAHILFRGNYDQLRDEVFPDTPAALAPMHKDWPKNRLGLAWWLVDKENPLTARVIINRYWQEIFGTGIVKSVDDFGTMGEAPSHPELLDWLAVEFREPTVGPGSLPWDVKRMIRLMVTSAAYRQSAATTPEKLAKDADNRLLCRGPRFRMDAEVLRDFALASSGLLVDKIGGPSVKPYQPPGVWEAVAMFSSNTRFYKPDGGEGLYRRSMYWFWKRSAPPPSMDIFNAPGRLACTVRRERTDTPLQALVTMNDPQWVEAARHLAELAMKEAASDFEHRLDFITMRAVSRRYDGGEREICRKTLDQFLREYQNNPTAANALLHVGDSKRAADLAPAEFAAWTVLASEIMNTDEALNK